MNNKFSRWLSRQRLARQKPTPSPFALMVVSVLKIAFLVVLCSFALWRTLLYRDVQSKLSKLKAAGFPVSGAELNAWRRAVSDEENGVLGLAQAFALLRNFPDRRSNAVAKTEILNRTNEWSPATREMITDYVHTNLSAVAKAREALKFPKFRHPADFSYGFDTQLPHLSRIRELTRMAALQAALEAESGKTNDWPERVVFQLNLAGTLDEEPALRSYLTRASIIRAAVKVTERNLNRAIPDDKPCQLLQSAFAHASETNGLACALIGERATMIPTFRSSWRELGTSGQAEGLEKQPREPHRYSGEPNPFIWLSGFFERDLDFYLEKMEGVAALAELPAPQSFELTNYLQRAEKVADERVCFLSGMFLSSLSKLTVREANTRANIELATTALAVERFRHDRHRLPENLGELTPQFLDAVPKDPFDGADLRYHRLSSGYVIYSIDADGHDDGGRERPENKKSSDQSTYDITFTVEH